MQVVTNVASLLPELIEEAKFFTNAEGLQITHEHIYGKEGVFEDEITIDGKKYSFSFSHEYNGELEYKRYLKRYAKLALYRAMSNKLGEKLPWGALTGIRPVKFAYGEGEGWRKEMGGVFDVTKEKLDLVSGIMNAQKAIYEKNANGVDLFVGIPFCPSRCLYCSFVSSEIGKSDRVDDYVAALQKEIAAAKPLIKNLRSVYVGGGTPISLPISRLNAVLDAIGDVKGTEYTVEAGRPDCINDEVLKTLKDHGVTRICVNPQTFNDDTLKLLGRRHTSAQILEAYALAKKYGFIVNMDLIAGLTGESFADFKKSVDKIIELSPENATVHTLSLKKGSRLKEEVERLPEGEVAKMISYSYKTLTDAGYEPYYTYRQKYMAGNLENTGYAKKGKVCTYNVDVMEEIADNLACGANAVTKKLFGGGERIERYGAPKDIPTYISKIDKIIEEKSKLFV
ncbi:MAG: coproporphyrinogen dehydrogenase HemZ [Clostridia bacterium]|nr:coproporphyrinogen dehydrogenase HemZ [Clostridia bacterium]